MRTNSLARAIPAFPTLILALALGSAQPAQAASPYAAIAPLVPADALGAAIIASPLSFLDLVSKAWTASGLAKSQGMEGQAFVESLIPFAKDAVGKVDPARPWAIVIAPGTAPDDSRPLILLPYLGKPEALVAATAKSGLVELGRSGGYLLLGDKPKDATPPLVFPPKAAADLSALERWPAESLALWVNPASFALIEKFMAESAAPKVTGSDDSSEPAPSWPVGDSFRGMLGGGSGDSRWIEVSNAFRVMLGGEPATQAADDSGGNDPSAPSASDAALAEATKNLVDGATKLLSQVATFSAALVPSKAGLVLRFALGAVPGSELATLLDKQSNAPAALTWASLVSGDALMSAAWSIDPSFATELQKLSATLVQAWLPSLEALSASSPLEGTSLSDLVATSMEESKRWVAALGARGAASVDLDAAAYSKFITSQGSSDGSGSPPEIPVTLMPKLRYVLEVRDPAAATSLLNAIPSSGYLATLLSSLRSELGMEFSLAAKKKNESGFAWSEIAADFGATKPPVIGPLLPALTLRWAVVGSKLAMTNEDAVTVLKPLTAGTAAKNSLATNADFIALTRTMPTRSQYLIAINAAKIAAMVAPIAGAAAGPAADPKRFGTWVNWLLTEKVPARGSLAASSLFEFGMGIPVRDIGALAELVKGLGSDKVMAK